MVRRITRYATAKSRASIFGWNRWASASSCRRFRYGCAADRVCELTWKRPTSALVRSSACRATVRDRQLVEDVGTPFALLRCVSPGGPHAVPPPGGLVHQPLHAKEHAMLRNSI